jgi:regulator of sigma E protease
MAIQLYQIAPLNRLNSGSYVGAVKEGAYAEGQGLQKGDRLVSVDGVSISSWKDLYDYVKPSAAPLVTATFERIAPEKKEFSIKFDPSLLVMKRYQLERYFLGGFEPASYRLEVTFLQSLYYGTTLTFDILLGLFTKSEEEITADSYFSDKVEKKSEVAAFGLIFPSYELGKESSKSWYDFLVVLVGMNLMAALLNIIPYPAFDGGHLAIILIESVTRQDLNMAWKERLAHFGLATSLLIMVAALGADVVSGLSYITGWLG